MAPLRTSRSLILGDRPPLDEDERRLVLRVVVAVVVPLTTMVVVVMMVIGWFAYEDFRSRSRTDRQTAQQAQRAAEAATRLALRLDEVRLEAEHRLAWDVFDECVENENQDASNAALFRKVRALVAQGPPTRARDELIQSLTDTIEAREPPGEKDCQVPPFPRPGNP